MAVYGTDVYANNEFYYSNVSTITTNFDVNPYYDDFDDKKNYHRILFKPGFSVQARELTQIQSMLQDQIQKFGQHVFKEGSMVLGGKFDLQTGAQYVKVGDKDTSGNDVDISLFKDQVVTGQVTGIQATVNLVLDGAEGTDKPKTLYVTYSSGNANTGEVVFAANEPLIANVGTLVVGNTTPTGLGTVFTINEGVRFCKQHFIHHNKQSVVVGRYDTNPTCKVGFVLTEEIVNSTQDSSLLDPALESSNYAAPGADRFKIIPTLTRLDIDDPAAPPEYVNLFVIKNNNVTEIAERPVYNIVNDELARRTGDESGDYYVFGFNVVVKEHLDNGTNDGYLTLDKGGDSNYLAYQIEKGKAYVKGYEINTSGSVFLPAQKSITYANVNGQSVSSKLGSYVVVKEAVGAWNLNSGTTIDLYNTTQNRVSTGVGSANAPSGAKIGTAKVMSISNAGYGVPGTANGQIRVHLFDVNMLGTNSFSTVKSLYRNNSSTSNVCADIVLSTSGTAVIKESTVPLLYFVGSNDIRSIRSSDGTVDTTFTFKRTKDVSITSSGTFTITETVDNEFFSYGSSTVSAADKATIFLTLNEGFDISISGTTVSGSGTKILTGSSTQFTRLNVGDKIRFSGTPGNVYVIDTITSDTVLTVTQNLPTLSSDTMSKVYAKGDMIDLSGTGYTSGSERSVTATTSSLSFDLGESFGSTRSGTVTYSVSRSSAREISKQLKISRYVKINSSTHTNSVNGPYGLGFSDVFRIKSIRSKTGSDFTTATEGTDVTSNFDIDDGQRNDFYGHGAITPKGALSSGTYLLVELDYFLPDYTLGVGYFSVDSYPVNDINPTSTQITTAQIPIYNYDGTGKGLDLRNHLDFRPVYTNTAGDATTVAGATTNPAAASSIQYDSNGLRIPADSQRIIFDYQKYLARIDVVAVDVRGQFRVIQGVPSTRPLTPVCPEELMSCARIYVSPYPSISPTYANQLKRPDLGCTSKRTSQVRYTMKDIGVIKQRVDNLENYVSLSLLEKSAADMKIIDEYGNDRFKNGIFADSFTSLSLSDISNPDHHICYDPKEGSIRPICDVSSIGYNLYSNTNAIQVDNLVLLPYTEETIVEQPHATTYRNVETTIFKFLGKMFLSPDTDYWVNTERLNALPVHFGATDEDITPYSVVYGSYETVVTGVTTSDPVLVSTTKTDSGWVLVGSNTSVIRAAYSTSNIEPDIFVGWRLVNRDYAAVTQTQKTYNDIVTVNDTYQTTTTTSTQQVRSMQETLQSIQNETHSLGDRVTNVAPIADIRPQVIVIHVKNVKASTRHFVYFDNVLMNDYVTPAVPVSSATSLDTVTIGNVTATATEGTTLYSDANGNIYALLRLPSDASKTFRTGTKQVIVTDSPTNETDATSYATSYFYAQGLSQYKQDTVMSTGTIVTEVKNGIDYGPTSSSAVKNYKTVSSNTIANVKVVTTTSGGGVNTSYPLAAFGSCMAYSFKLVSLYGDEGMFLSSVDVYFGGKDPVKGVWFEVRAMNNAGQITTMQVPYSEVFLTPDQVNVSNDGSVATNVKFKVPLFLMNNTEYAFIIHTQGCNPNYYMYVSVLGENDILTQKPVTERPLTGTLFTTNNNTDWDPVNRVDLKAKFNRAVFDTTVTGEVILGNQTREYLELPDPVRSSANTAWFGEKINGNDTLSLSTPSPSLTVSVGDRIIGQTSGANTQVVSISGTNYKVAGTGYKVGETVKFAASNGSLYGTTSSSVLLITTPTGEIYSSKSRLNAANSTSVVLTNSNGLFSANDIMTGLSSANTTTVGGISKYVYAAVRFEPRFIDFTRTYVDFSMSTRSNTGTASDYIQVTPSTINEYDIENAIFSRSTEVSAYAGAPSNLVKATLSTTSDYLTPVIDLGKTYSVYHRNLINANTSGETAASGGGLKNKYISEVVTLADGQDAEDLRIILSAYRPPSSNSDFIVYVRFSHAEDFEPIWQRNWNELSFDSSVYSTLANRKDWKEYNFKLPTTLYTGTNDQGDPIVGYTNSVGTAFSGFKQFQIKIGLKSDSSAIYPRIADLRAIALQK